MKIWLPMLSAICLLLFWLDRCAIDRLTDQRDRAFRSAQKSCEISDHACNLAAAWKRSYLQVIHKASASSLEYRFDMPELRELPDAPVAPIVVLNR